MACVNAIDGIAGLALISTPVGDFDRRKVARLAQEWTVGRYVKEALHLRWAQDLLRQDRRAMYGVFIRQKLRLFKGQRPDSAGFSDLRWISSKAVEQLSFAVGRQIPLLFVFGSTDDYFEDFLLAARGELGRIIHAAGSRLTVRTMPGRIHGFMPLPAQDALIGLIREWLTGGEAPLRTSEPRMIGGDLEAGHR